jgi:hypothetical protein
MLCHLLTKIVSLCAIFYVSPREPIGVSFLNNNQNITLVNDQDYLSCFTSQPIVRGPHLYVLNDNHYIIHNEETTISLPNKNELILNIAGSKTVRQIIKVKEGRDLKVKHRVKKFLRTRIQEKQKLIRNLKSIDDLISSIAKSKEKI